MKEHFLRLMSLFLLMTLLGCVSVINCQGGTTKMALIASLNLPKTSILYQEDMSCTLILENKGLSSVKIVPPRMASSLPILRLVDLRTGKESLHETAVHPQALPAPTPWTNLAPGEKSALGFQLKEKIPDLLPGDYEISAIYDYNEGELTCDSSPIQLKVKPATPHNIFLASARGGVSNVYYGVWMNLDKNRSEIVWGHLDIVAGGGVKSVSIVGQAGIRTQPVLSVPANGSLAQGQWLAWLDNNLLNFTFFKSGNEIMPPGKVPLNSMTGKIIGPLHCNQPTNNNEKIPTGEALLLLGNSPSIQFQTFLFTENGAKPGITAILPGGQMPVWITSASLTQGQRMAPYILAKSGLLELNILPWGTAGDTAMQPRSLSSWDGDFLAANCVLDNEDVLHGAILIWAGKPEESKQLKILLWTLNPNGEFVKSSPKAVSWDFTEQIIKAEISVTTNGQPAAIVRKDSGEWNFINSAGKISVLAGKFMETDLALTINFLNMVKPVVIGGIYSLGLKIMEPDGTPLPPLPGY